MQRTVSPVARFLLPLSLLVTVFALNAFASTIPVGFVSWDVNFPGNAGQFDISNDSGPNATPFPDPTFPVTTSVNLSSLKLTVDFSDGSVIHFGSSYFTLGGDGLSFDGSPIAIGGANPQPVDATLTGDFSPLTITLNDGSTDTISAAFSATITDSPTLVDGDLAIINATTAGTTSVPEPGTLILMGSCLLAMVLFRHNLLRRSGKALICATRDHGRLLIGLLLCGLILPSSSWAVTLVRLNADTTPTSGVAGVNNVNITGSGFPVGTITPASVMVMWEGTCGGPAVTSVPATSVKTILGSVKRVNVTIPVGLASGAWFLQISDAAAGDANFGSSNCSEVQVTHTNATLAACVPTSSLGVNAPVKGPAPVTAYVPLGCWECGTTGVQAVPIEPTPVASPTAIATANVVNSCSANPATGEIVCTANNTDVYEIKGTSLIKTLTSSSDLQANFSGGFCNNCGVAIDALNNKAWIEVGLSTAPFTSGVQPLDLNTDTFGPAIPTLSKVSENISVDPTRGYILSASEFPHSYDLLQFSGNSATDFQNSISTANEMDSSAEDCSTGIALASDEFRSEVILADLTQAKFTTGSAGPPPIPNTWTSGTNDSGVNVITLCATSGGCGFSAGTTGLSVAQGSSHLAIITGEFGGNVFAILQLPATSGSGTPALVDYAVVGFGKFPNEPDGGSFQAGLDPHTVTAYVSPNDGKAYALMASSPNAGSNTNCLAKIDMAAILGAARTGLTNFVNTVPPGAITFFWTGNGTDCTKPPI